jgi:ABC-type branched-subunit amino acid transport system substrate-binding protein
MPYSGPVSAFGALGKGEVGYFRMLNEKGGINGRKVNLISLDDGYAPPKTVEQTRRLVESEEVALIFSSIGTAHNTAIAKYLQGRNIPQLFLASGASKFADVAQYPQATMGVRRRSATRPASMRAMRLRKIRMRNSRSFRRTTITGATICWA